MSVFIVLLLLTKKPKALTDKILATWIAIIAIHLLGYYFKETGYWEKYPHLIGTTAPLPLLHGPLLFLYCLYALKAYPSFRYKDLLHFLPAIAAFIYMSPFFFGYTPEQKLQLDQGVIKSYSTFANILLIVILVSGITYAMMSYRLSKIHKSKLEHHYSYREGISLKWLRYCILSIGLVFLSAIVVVLLRDALDFNFLFNPEYIIYSILIAFIFYIGYFGIRHENIFANQSQENKSSNANQKYRKSAMKEEVSQQLYEQLLEVMKQKKPYLQPKLTSAHLAESLKISTNQLSQLINQKAGVNFHDFVNRYRVEEFLQRARSNKNYSLLALAYESGFNSKSSFNTIFKKQMGSTPSQYLASDKNAAQNQQPTTN